MGICNMPINIPSSLPAASTLENENIFVMTQSRAIKQDIRPLRILLLNLMPKKIETETQILRLLSNSPIQINIELLQTKNHISKNTSKEHMIKFYKTIDQIQNQRFDGMIVTGAPVEKIKFEHVDYWNELCKIFDWAKLNVYSTLNICWGAIANLYYNYGINPHILKDKIFGIFPHNILDNSHTLLRGFDEIFWVPHSRYFDLDAKEINNNKNLKILTSSPISGIHIVADKNCRNFFITGHSEYDLDTLANEYKRDLNNNNNKISIPYAYFQNDDPNSAPVFNWRCHANMLFSNWLNYIVYQNTPYNLNDLDFMKR